MNRSEQSDAVRGAELVLQGKFLSPMAATYVFLACWASEFLAGRVTHPKMVKTSCQMSDDDSAPSSSMPCLAAFGSDLAENGDASAPFLPSRRSPAMITPSSESQQVCSS